MTEGKIIIAIDGHSGCGKSSTAKIVAKRLDYIYIDTGAMYRASTYWFIKNGIELSNKGEVIKMLETIDLNFRINPASGANEMVLNGASVEKEIRTLNVSERVSEVSALPVVRKKMVEMQRNMGANKGVVMDGRDIGTVVFPNAELKIFMTADLAIRAKRRLLELEEKGEKANFEEVYENLKKRDHLDSTRKESPLLKANDAVLIDTSHLTFDEQVEKIVTLAQQKLWKSRT